MHGRAIESSRASGHGARRYLCYRLQRSSMIEMIAIGLAGWRAASLLVQEQGPWGIFGRLRWRLGARDLGDPEGFFAELLSCVWCTSVWTCVGAWGLWQISHEAVLVAAGMSLAVLVQRAARE